MAATGVPGLAGATGSIVRRPAAVGPWSPAVRPRSSVATGSTVARLRPGLSGVVILFAGRLHLSKRH